MSRKENDALRFTFDKKMLQWSRDFSVAEGVATVARIGAYDVLQWSRDFSVAEGSTRAPTVAGRLCASMEPRL